MQRNTHSIAEGRCQYTAYLRDLRRSSGSGRGQHEAEQQLVLLKQAPLHLVENEAGGKGGQEAQASGDLRCLVADINAVVEHGDEVGEGGLVHGGDESQVSHHKVQGGCSSGCRPVLLPSLQAKQGQALSPKATQMWTTHSRAMEGAL